MISLFRTYWFLVFCKGLAGILLLINYLFNIDLIFLFKIPLILSTLTILLFHSHKKFYFGFIASLFLIYLGISILAAIYFKNIPSFKTLSHLYTIFIAIFGVSFGYFFGKNYSNETDVKVKKYMRWLFWLCFLILFVYFYGHYFSGQIEYFGFDTDLPTSIAFFISQKQFGFVGVSLLLIFFSGKRSPLITTLLISSLYIFKYIKFREPVHIILLALAITLIVSASSYVYNTGLLWRYENIASIDTEDEDSFYIATSGRSAEFIGIWDHMNSNPIRWIIGSGLGGAYYIDIIRGDYVERFQHYSHLSLLSFVFLFGLPFVGFLLIYILGILVKNFKYLNNQYYLGLITFFIASFFGASMLVDSLFWVFLGINIYIVNAPKNALILIKK